MDDNFSVNELMQIPEFNAQIIPWVELLDNQLNLECLIHFLEKNEKLNNCKL